MTKREKKKAGKSPFLEGLTPEQLRGAKVINEPISVTALRGVVAKLKPEYGFSPELYIEYRADNKQWYVLTLYVEDMAGSLLLYVIPGIDRITPFITKRHGQKGYRSLDTLVRQMTDIFGKETLLTTYFRLWEYDDQEEVDP